MAYQALYRVWRSQRFEDLVGQEHVTQTLKNALREKSLSHAYLFHGPRGTGKTSAAKILAKAVNCIHGPAPEPCNQCEICNKITEGSLMDVVEIDAASNRGVDEIRDLREKVKYAPTEAKYKVYIIDEVHMLTTEAFNALLKTLEEPPTHVIFILATTEPHKLLPTILSRCQRYPFRRLPFEKIVERLRLICTSVGVVFEEQALSMIARAADGGMRDALSLLDQVLALGGDHFDEETVLTVTGAVSQKTIRELFESIAEREPVNVLARLEDLLTYGVEVEKILQDMTYVCRDLLLVKTVPKLEESIDEETINLAEKFSAKRLYHILDRLILAEQQMKWVSQTRILFETLLIRLCHDAESSENRETHELETQIDMLKQMVEQLKKKVEQSHSLPTSPPIQEKKQISEEPVSSFNKGSAKLLSEIKQAWPQMLNLIKKERITVHAWLVDGEPVAATNDTIVIAFKSNIHRQTTERPSNRAVIEKVFHQVLGRPYTLKTYMYADWQHSLAGPKKKERPSSKREVVEKAMEVFGEELVQVKEKTDS